MSNAPKVAPIRPLHSSPSPSTAKQPLAPATGAPTAAQPLGISDRPTMNWPYTLPKLPRYWMELDVRIWVDRPLMPLANGFNTPSWTTVAEPTPPVMNGSLVFMFQNVG